MKNVVPLNLKSLSPPLHHAPPPGKEAMPLELVTTKHALPAKRVQDQVQGISEGGASNPLGSPLLVPPRCGLHLVQPCLPPTASSLNLPVTGMNPSQGVAPADDQEKVKVSVEEGLKRMFGTEAAITIHEPFTTGLNSLLCYRISVNGEDYHLKAVKIDDSSAREGFQSANARCKDFSGLNVGPALIGIDVESSLRVTKYIPGQDLTEAEISTPPIRGQAIKFLRDLHRGKQTQDLVHFDSRRVKSEIEKLKEAALDAATSQHTDDIVRASKLAQYSAQQLSGYSYFNTLCHLDPSCKNFRNDGTRL